MALLLQVTGMTPQWSEALVRNEIDTLHALRRASLDAIQTRMRQERDRGVIPDEPTAAQIAEMLKDAAVMTHTGVLAGTVFGADWQPVPGATVELGPARTETDTNGHFRLFRIPLVRKLALRIAHSDHGTLVTDAPAVALDATMVGLQTFRLPAKPDDTTPPALLSELEGDIVPSTYSKARQVALSPDALREGDVLVVRNFYSSAPDAQLVSKLKAYQDGELIVYTIRLPRSRLPAGAQLKDQFRVVNGQLTRVNLSSTQLHRHKLRLRLRKAMGGRPRPSTEEDRRAFVHEALTFLTGQGYYRDLRGR
jgi:hypothetical protein